MKKILLSFAMCFLLVSCGNTETAVPTHSTQTENSATTSTGLTTDQSQALETALTDFDKALRADGSFSDDDIHALIESKRAEETQKML